MRRCEREGDKETGEEEENYCGGEVVRFAIAGEERMWATMDDTLIVEDCCSL
jgi:hypothetical protein